MKKRNLIFCGAACSALLLFAAGCGPSTAEECLKNGADRGVNGDWKGALKMADRAAELSPDNVSALVLRAVACDALGERDRALDAARQAAVRNPESFAAQYTLGRLYAADPARYTDALPALTRAASLRGFKDRGTLVMLANTLVAQRSPSAMSWLNTLVRVAPELESEAAYHNLLGIAQAHARRPDAARQAFTRAYQQDRNNPTIVYNIGTFFDRYASNPRAAASFYRKFLELAGEDAAFAARKSEVTARLARIR